ncbi:MAG: hypothetical protein IH577_00960 [Deltaproteobacteria bacterium]|nr:hypothetical protein [Deltaproteobacteria bacterium]
MTNIIYNVIGGIITAIILFFFQPILGLMYKTIISVTNTIGGRISGLPYIHASRGEMHILLLNVSVIMIGIFVAGYYLFLNETRTRNMSITEDVNKTTWNKVIKISDKLLLVMSKSMFVLYFILVIISMSISSGTIKMITKFNQRLTILSPYISDYEYKVYKSSWASMKSKPDYESIIAGMDNVARTKRIILPKP